MAQRLAYTSVIYSLASSSGTLYNRSYIPDFPIRKGTNTSRYCRCLSSPGQCDQERYRLFVGIAGGRVT